MSGPVTITLNSFSQLNLDKFVENDKLILVFQVGEQKHEIEVKPAQQDLGSHKVERNDKISFELHHIDTKCGEVCEDKALALQNGTRGVMLLNEGVEICCVKFCVEGAYEDYPDRDEIKEENKKEEEEKSVEEEVLNKEPTPISISPEKNDKQPTIEMEEENQD